MTAITRQAGLDELADSFELAEQTEATHRAKVDAWIKAGLDLSD